MLINKSRNCDCCGQSFFYETCFEDGDIPYCDECVEAARLYAMCDFDEKPMSPTPAKSNLDWSDNKDTNKRFDTGIDL